MQRWKKESPAGSGAFAENTDIADNKLSFAAINAHALATGLLLHWYPRAKRYGQSLRIGNLAGDKGESLWICLRTGAWKDHATGEGGGDVISLYAAMQNISQGQALKQLAHYLHFTSTHSFSKEPIEKSAKNDAAKIAFALDIWEQGHSIEGTLAEVYLKSRCLSYCADMPLRFHATCPHGQGRFPAMLALITDTITGEPCGIHRTFIKPDGSGKADFKPNKMMLGRASNAVIRLTPDDDVTTGLGIVEGIENGLSIIGISWTPIWVVLSAGGMRNFQPFLGIESLTIFADHDVAGRKAAQSCARNWTAAGKETIIRTPSIPGSDWNDVVRESLK